MFAVLRRYRFHVTVFRSPVLMPQCPDVVGSCVVVCLCRREWHGVGDTVVLPTAQRRQDYRMNSLRHRPLVTAHRHHYTPAFVTRQELLYSAGFVSPSPAQFTLRHRKAYAFNSTPGYHSLGHRVLPYFTTLDLPLFTSPPGIRHVFIIT